jgi:hypothetical protein
MPGCASLRSLISTRKQTDHAVFRNKVPMHIAFVVSIAILHWMKAAIGQLHVALVREELETCKARSAAQRLLTADRRIPGLPAEDPTHAWVAN